MKQYMVSVWHVAGEAPPSAEEMEEIARDVDAFNDRLAAERIMTFGAGLHPPETATVVNVPKGREALITDGPFAEAKEQIGGFWILKAPDLDVVLKYAEEASAACHGPVEVRPLQEEAAD